MQVKTVHKALIKNTIGREVDQKPEYRLAMALENYSLVEVTAHSIYRVSPFSELKQSTDLYSIIYVDKNIATRT